MAQVIRLVLNRVKTMSKATYISAVVAAAMLAVSPLPVLAGGAFASTNVQCRHVDTILCGEPLCAYMAAHPYLGYKPHCGYEATQKGVDCYTVTECVSILTTDAYPTYQSQTLTKKAKRKQ